MIFSTIFLIFDLGGTDFKQWSSFMQWIFGIYAVGNSAQKISYTVLNNKKKQQQQVLQQQLKPKTKKAVK